MGMSAPRAESSSSNLADGRVLVVGGFTDPTEPDPLLASAELYDSKTGSWTGPEA